MEHEKLNVVQSNGFIFAGAIFMSNRETKLECLRRKLFGLPLSQIKFLNQVKAGMILFLFEHEKRKLYGVFEATSDGALNIVPDAFVSTGRSYPAQILFKRVWICKPLREDEFRSAIEENYYTQNKFHFGLSYGQVVNLIHLFNYSRRINFEQKQGDAIPNRNIVIKLENKLPDKSRPTETVITYFKPKSENYSREEGKSEAAKLFTLPPQASPSNPPSPYATGVSNQLNISFSSCPHPSCSQSLISQRNSLHLPYDPTDFPHFSTASDTEYVPLPVVQSPCYSSNFDSMPCKLPCCYYGSQANQDYSEFPDYIPLTEESQHTPVGNQSLSSEYIPVSYIPSTCKKISNFFFDEMMAHQRRIVETDEHYRLHADDFDSSRTSVFSRLSRHPDPCDPEAPEPSSSLDKLMSILSERRRMWKKNKPSEQSVDPGGVFERYRCTAERSKTDQFDEAEDAGFNSAMEVDPSNDVVDEESFELTFYNFKRRNAPRTCEAGEDSENCGGGKRKRMVRPFIDASTEAGKESDAGSDVFVLETGSKHEPDGEPAEQNQTVSAELSADYIPID